MRRTIAGLSLAVFTLFGFSQAAAQDTKSARGTVTAMAADSITVKAGEREMRFDVDAKTVLTAEGAGTAAREAAAAGKGGPKLAEFIKVGDAVEVSYHETGGTMHAARIRRVRSAGPGGGMTSEDRAETSNGTVQSVSGTSLTIQGTSAGGAASFTQTFTIDTNTRVVGEGMGTAARAAAEKGAKTTITDLVSMGDTVAVTYRKKGDTLVATQVRVTRKGK